MSVAIYCWHPLFLTLECMSPVGSLDPWTIVGSLDPLVPFGSVDPDRSICGVVSRVVVLVWLTSIPRPRLYWSNPVE